MPAPARLDRHAPCPCGSQRLLLVCCLPWEEAFQRLTARLAAFAEAPGVRRVAARAATALSAPEDAGGDRAERIASRYPGFAEWLLQDYVASRGRGTLLGEFADQAEGLGPQEQQLLFWLLLSPVRAYEVTEAPAARGVQVKDLLAGSECSVGPFGIPEGVIRSDICVARLVPLGRLRRPGISLLRLPPGSQAEMLAFLRTTYRMARAGRHLSLEEYLDRAAHLYHQFFLFRGREFGGRSQRTCRWAAFVACRALYQGAQTGRMRAALDRQSELERVGEDEEGVRYAWIGSAQSLRRGTIRLGSSEVQASAETREDLEAIKGLLEGCLRGLIRLVREEREEPLAAQPRRAAALGRDPAGTTFLRRLVTGWPDAPVAALGDRSPRETCRSAAGREEVVQLLLDLEREMARQRRTEKAWAETGPLWEALSLTPPAPARGQPTFLR